MRRLLREPLVHFLLAGAVLVAASAFLSDDEIPRDDEIVVSAGQIEHLAARFVRTWHRPPAPAELAGLIDDHVREEIAYREGVAVGLADDDAIIRRRIRQKLEFIAMDVASLVAPTDEDLAAFLTAHAEDYREPQRLTFAHVFVDPGRHSGDRTSEPERLLALLRKDPARNLDDLGDPIMIAPHQEDLEPSEIAATFGRDFAAALVELPAGTVETSVPAWHGPIASGYGLHLVRILARTESRLPALAEIRDAVRRDWEHARREDAKARFYVELKARYEVTIEWPDLASRDSSR